MKLGAVMDKIQRIIDHPDFQLYLRKNRHLEEKRVFCTHDFDHLLTVARLTYLLLVEQGEQPIIKELAYAAGLLHDIGRWREYTENIDHALSGAKLARPILEASGFQQTDIDLILIAIREHRKDYHVGDNRHPLSKALFCADLFSRLCFKCPAKEDCRKYYSMPQKDSICY